MRMADFREAPSIVRVQTGSGWQTMELHGEKYRYADIAVWLQNDALYVSAGQPVFRVELSWPQELDRPVKILGDHWERGYGDLEWRGIVPERVLPWYTLVYDGELVYGYGVKTGPNAFVSFREEQKKLILSADLRAGTDGVELDGKTLCACELVQMVSSERPFAAARAFCAQMCEYPVLPAQPVYGGNDWYTAYGHNSDELIMEHAKWVADWADGNENRPFMVVDDGWQECRWGNNDCNGGPWDSSNYKFPAGMADLTSRIKAEGVKPGIWFRPLLTMRDVPMEWKLKIADGGTVLDPSRDDVLEIVRADIHRLAEWGFELVKHDFSTYDIFGRWGAWMEDDLTNGGWHFSRRDLTTAQVIRRLYTVLREGAGNISIIGCNTVGHLAAGIFDIQRCGDDTSGRDWLRTRKMGINTVAFRMPQQGTFFAADGDCVGLTTAVSWEKNRQWLALLAESGTPLFVSAEKAAIGAEQKKALKEAFAKAAQPIEPGEPLDWLYNRCPSRWMLNGKLMEFDW